MRYCRLVAKLLLVILLPAAGAARAQGDGREAVQVRMLELIRDTALKSDYAGRQARHLVAADSASALQYAAGQFRRMGLDASLEQLHGTQEATLKADWSGRSAPDELVLLSAHVDAGAGAFNQREHALGVAAALGVVEVFTALRLKPRRTVRVVTWAGAEHGFYGATGYTRKQGGRVALHAAVVESNPGHGRPVGVRATIPESALSALDPLLHALRPLGVSAFEARRHSAETTISPLEHLGVPGFSPVSATSAGPVPVAAVTDPHASLRQHVALLAATTWWLGEMDDPLPRLPPEHAHD